MNYYLLRDCAGILANIWTNSQLGLALGAFLQSVEYPGVCWEIIQIQQVDPGGTVTVTHVGPVFTSCTDCSTNIVQGCTDPTACNFNPCATIDDGSCFYNNATIRILCNEPLTNCN